MILFGVSHDIFSGQYDLRCHKNVFISQPPDNTRDIKFSMTGLVNWARRPAQVEMTVNTVHEGLLGYLWML